MFLNRPGTSHLRALFSNELYADRPLVYIEPNANDFCRVLREQEYNATS